MKKYLEARIELFVISLVLIVAIVAFSILNIGTAWFAKNDQVSAGGFSLSVSSMTNLIIAKDPDDITSGVINFDVNFTDSERTNMIAVTRDETIPSTYLKYVTNHYAVDKVSGNALPGSSLEFAPVPETDNEIYFVDHVVYLASVVDSIEVASLTATITVSDQSYLENEFIKAASIDFYVGEVSATGYRGTTSIAKSLSGAEDKSIDLFESEGGVVPLNTEGYITVIMRCYFDGALVDGTSGKAYINSYTVNTDKVLFGVQFAAQDKD